MGIFEAQPVNGRRIVTMHLQIESDNVVNILLSGNTWPFRSRLDAHGVHGMFVGEGEKQVYYRIMKDIDVSDKVQKERLMEVLGGGVLNFLAIRVIIDKEPEKDSRVEEFVKELRALPSCHFK